MGNKSNELVELFRLSIINKNKRPIHSTHSTRSGLSSPILGVHRIPGMSTPPILGSIKIYFYEWSDVCRIPRQFDSIEEFDNFLKSHGLYMQLYQRELIRDLKEAFVSCYRGKKELCVRGSYKYLLETMNDHDRLQTQLEMREQGIPYGNKDNNIPRIGRPPMYAFDSQTEMEEGGGNWFG